MRSALCIKEEAVKETGKINYVEIPAKDLEATKRFFG
ncbi:MAG: glyoxalase family protein, partial [Rhodopirellula sp.]|nr:glyoxalase family protein [Rhodopirellula sp.]